MRTRLVRPVVIAAAVVLSLSFFSCGKRESSLPAKKAPEITMVVHGGAGTISRDKMTPEKEKAVRDKLAEALQAGHTILQNRGTALDAVEAAIKILEDSPLFNAGKGAVFTAEGKNELDASIMDGATLKAGAVASVTTIKNPIAAARAVMTQSKHVLLAGPGAESFAKEKGLEIVPPHYFFTQERWDELQKIKESEKASVTPPSSEKVMLGTVGALALDSHGNLAAGTSTGGLTNKMHGRVGDSPIIGAGTYANNKTCAVSGTGQGEYFIRLEIAYDVSALMEYGGMTLDAAADKVIREKLTGLGGTGGIIALDKDGNIAAPFNTGGMYRGWIRADGQAHTAMYADEEVGK
jgi:beta-aspartyl-peptidase (threonine type)